MWCRGKSSRRLAALLARTAKHSMTIGLQHRLYRAHRARSDHGYFERVLNKTPQAARNVGPQQWCRAEFKALGRLDLVVSFLGGHGPSGWGKPVTRVRVATTTTKDPRRGITNSRGRTPLPVTPTQSASSLTPTLSDTSTSRSCLLDSPTVSI